MILITYVLKGVNIPPVYIFFGSNIISRDNLPQKKSQSY
jgi:hypothetical protein